MLRGFRVQGAGLMVLGLGIQMSRLGAFGLGQGGVIFGHAYLEGHRDLVSGLVIRIARDTVWGIGLISLLTKSP